MLSDMTRLDKAVKIRQLLLNSLLPNATWNHRRKEAGKYRLAYWAVRLALMLIIIFLVLHLGIRQHPAVR